jgi:hypothetical protein
MAHPNASFLDTHLIAPIVALGLPQALPLSMAKDQDLSGSFTCFAFISPEPILGARKERAF